MKFKLTFITGVVALLFSYWLYAKSDFEGVSNFDIKDLTKEVFDKISGNSKEFSPQTVLSGSDLFSHDFENNLDWILLNENINAWHIGNAVANGGEKSLYISNTKGLDNTYDNGLKTLEVSYALSPVINVPADAEDYVLSFDWRSNGNNADDLAVFVIPADYVPVVGERLSVDKSKGTLLKEKMIQQLFFKKENIEVDLRKYKGKPIRIVYQWAYNAFTQNQPPAAIDNIRLYQYTCKVPSGMKVSDITLEGSTVSWTSGDASITNFDVVVTTEEKYPSVDQAGIKAVKGAATYTFTGLKYSTYYYVWYRSACSDTNKSYWVGPVKFMTLCGPYEAPFVETFNTDTLSFECWAFLDANNDGNAGKTHNLFRRGSNGPYEGNNSIVFQTAGSSSHDDWLITPEFKLDGGLYEFSYYYKTSSSGTNDFSLLLSEDGRDIASFKKVLLPSRPYLVSNYIKETVYIKDITGVVSIAWHLKTTGSVQLMIDLVELKKVVCAKPKELSIDNRQPTSVNLQWTDDINSAWEYAVIAGFNGTPPAKGIATNQKKVTVTQELNGAPLSPNRVYQYFVRGVCSNDTFSEWAGPFIFTTACSVVTLPYTDDFDEPDTRQECWTFIDSNKDAIEENATFNKWRYTKYNGAGEMYFYGTGGVNSSHDDWLVSPSFDLSGGLYEITYMVKASAMENNYELKLSTTGISPESFTTTIMPLTSNKNTVYVKKTHYIENVTGIVNLGFHVKSSGNTNIYIDDFSIKKVSCYAPDNDITISNLTTNSATFTWQDDVNSEWECFVQEEGVSPLPLSGGALVRTKSFNATRLNTAGTPNLLPNTDYEFFVRSSCGAGRSSWIGPIKFRTECATLNLPFWEGFNSDSNTLPCWELVDANNDFKTNFAGNAIWSITKTSSYVYEGNQALSFSSSSGSNDDWAISPTFNLSANKIYRLKYNYQIPASMTNEFAVLLSEDGKDLSKFTETLVSRKVYSGSAAYQEEKLFVTGYGGDVNFAFHINYKINNTRLAIDNIFFEEVTNCPEPLNLSTKDIEGTQAILEWTDDFNATNWEYFVRKVGVIKTPPTGSGTAVSSKSTIATHENSGRALMGNTVYEFFVRTVCGPEEFSDWSDPVRFRTACTVFDSPFWEGFNGNTTLPCWTIVDGNKDATSPTSNGIWKQINTLAHRYEGSHVINFTQSSAVESDDWLISPLINFLPNKVYRVKFHWKGTTTNENTLEILASNSGLDKASFAHVVAPKATYRSADYTESIYYVSGLSGEVAIAWHVVGTGSKNFYIENVFIDEVLTCPQPIELEVKDIEAKQVTVSWKDNFGATDWSYRIQKKGEAVPGKSATGVATKNKENIATSDYSGKALEANTDYEYYVQTICGDETGSLWTGPFYFTTTCKVYQAPFWDGFNKDSVDYRCWSIINSNNDSTIWKLVETVPYEGDRVMNYTGYGATDDWLVSPGIELDGGMYVLKYHYRTGVNNQNTFEVFLSTNGANATDFTTPLVKLTDYNNDQYVEEVVFIDGINGVVNIGWHAVSKGAMSLSIDNVSLKKVTTCPEPYNIKSTNLSSTSVDIEWKQDGGIAQWEVVVVEYGKPMPNNPNVIRVNGNPRTVLTNLKEGGAYEVYIRARCLNGTDVSSWTSPYAIYTAVVASDDCGGAITIPVNPTSDCVNFVAVSTAEATMDDKITVPSCLGGNSMYNLAAMADMWFEFTATATTHMLSFDNVRNLYGTSIPAFRFALYQGDCSAISMPIKCVNITTKASSNSGNKLTDNKNLLKDLIPGTKYLLRVGVERGNYLFNICLTTTDVGYVSVSTNGDRYTVDELVKDILIKSSCDLVSNVKYQAGKEPSGNTFGYFNKNNSTFPFEEGIVLATHNIYSTPGPYDFEYNGNRGRVPVWTGDEELNAVIDNIGGAGFGADKYVSIVEFDFIPIKDSIQFEYIFASQSYIYNCGSVCKEGGALFAAWVTEIETGDGQNLAVVPGTLEPIALSSIRDSEKSGAACGSVHPEYYGQHYENGQDNPLLAPINYVGVTKPMKSEMMAVKPGVKYRIKLAVADFCGTSSHTSAVFFNARSFDLGTLDLGADLLVKDNTAVCSQETKTIHSGLDADNVEISWYKDEELLVGENTADLEVGASGTYKVVANYKEIKCEVIGEVKVEIFPLLSEILNKPKVLVLCKNVLENQVVDLTQTETSMFEKVDRKNYEVFYYHTNADAEMEENALTDPANFEITSTDLAIEKYIRVSDSVTGCWEIFEIEIRFEAGVKPSKRSNVEVCSQYTFPELEANQYYYTESAANGVQYFAGEVLDIVGEHTIYVLQLNGDGGCYEEISYEVSITEFVVADVFEDVLRYCVVYDLPELSTNNHFYKMPGGMGQEFYPGDIIKTNEVIYVYASSKDGLCTDESSFKVTFTECPIQKGISPNGDGLNDSFDLSAHDVSSLKIYNRYGSEVYSYGKGYEQQWMGQDKNGNALPDGTYYYVIISFNETRTGWVQINR